VGRSFPEVTVIRLGDNAGAAARTVGVRALGTPYVAFSDDDSWWAPGALSRAADLLDAHPEVGLVAARVLVGPEQREDPACARMARSPLEPDPGVRAGVPVLGFIACGAVARCRAYLDVGGFQDGFGVGGEEQLLATDLRSADHVVVYVHDVVAHHHPSATRDQRTREAGAVRNDLWFEWMRRRPRRAIASTVGAVARALRQAHVRRGIVQALPGLPRALRRRRRIPARLERELDAVEASRAELDPARTG
jgi:GT2 family glycosyltransferase